jgi:hypothetical protein
MVTDALNRDRWRWMVTGPTMAVVSVRAGGCSALLQLRQQSGVTSSNSPPMSASPRDQST